MVRSKKKNCASWQLLMQSGGASTQVAGTTGGSQNVAGRNQFFDKDYYLDELEIESIIPLKGTGAANTATNIKFKITEYEQFADLHLLEREATILKEIKHPLIIKFIASFCDSKDIPYIVSEYAKIDLEKMI
jgi:Tol biopolymer transport system component